MYGDGEAGECDDISFIMISRIFATQGRFVSETMRLDRLSSVWYIGLPKYGFSRTSF